MKKWFPLAFALVIIVLITAIAIKPRESEFTGERAFAFVENQMSLGPRIPGSQAHSDVINYISSELKKCGWMVDLQIGQYNDHPITNIVAKHGEKEKLVILGAHYDSRMFADKDPEIQNQELPVPGANDGASGVAVLLELSCSLPKNLPYDLWLVFFDMEDQGKIEGSEWIEGSRLFVDRLQKYPEAVIILDMIGDKDLDIRRESNSDKQLTAEIWSVASDLGYEDFFISDGSISILDDHTPFLEKGIPAIDIIDFNYPFWHTTDDTLEKVSSKSLEIVGHTIYEWLMRNEPE